MTHVKHPLAALVLTAAVGLSACGSSATPTVTPSATLQPLAGSPSGRIVLTPLGAQRIGVQTAVVRSAPPPAKPATPVGGPTVIIPYSSVIYAPDGSTFAFTSSSPLNFSEVPVTIDHINGSLVYLTKGPSAGTKVVTTGAEELFGVQTGVLPQT
jgi:hypothetical protein